MSDDDELVSPTMANVAIENFVKNTVDETLLNNERQREKC